MSWSITQALSYVMLSIIAVLWSPYVFSFPLFFRDSRFFTGLSFSLGWPYTGLGEPSAAWFRAHRCWGWGGWGWGGEGGGGGWVMLVSEGMVSVSWLISGKACAKCAARWQVTPSASLCPSFLQPGTLWDLCSRCFGGPWRSNCRIPYCYYFFALYGTVLLGISQFAHIWEGGSWAFL